MNIDVKVIPHGRQRYETLGDWLFDDKTKLSITVSETGDWRMNTLIAVHEIIEAALCRNRGIAEMAVSHFDMNHPELDDPGNDPQAPYHREHVFAECVERLLAAELSVEWAEYERVCEAL